MHTLKIYFLVGKKTLKIQLALIAYPNMYAIKCSLYWNIPNHRSLLWCKCTGGVVWNWIVYNWFLTFCALFVACCMSNSQDQSTTVAHSSGLFFLKCFPNSRDALLNWHPDATTKTWCITKTFHSDCHSLMWESIRTGWLIIHIPLLTLGWIYALRDKIALNK